MISREEILKLYAETLKEVSAHSIGQWLKVVTKDQFIVIPKIYLVDNSLFIEQIKEDMEKLELQNIEDWM